jgi:hypothetical protein
MWTRRSEAIFIAHPQNLNWNIMKVINIAKYVLACASVLVAADVTFVVSLKPLPGKADAVSLVGYIPDLGYLLT